MVYVLLFNLFFKKLADFPGAFINFIYGHHLTLYPKEPASIREGGLICYKKMHTGCTFGDSWLFIIHIHVINSSYFFNVLIFIIL